VESTQFVVSVLQGTGSYSVRQRELEELDAEIQFGVVRLCLTQSDANPNSSVDVHLTPAIVGRGGATTPARENRNALVGLHAR
jgi:hypothetical protein